jgi:hypothetical protein
MAVILGAGFPQHTYGEAAVMKFRTTEGISQKILQEHCDGAFVRITAYRDAAGRVGGYALLPAIPDSPIPYLDCDGNQLTSFHIFGSDAEKAQASRIIGALTKQFSVVEHVECTNK